MWFLELKKNVFPYCTKHAMIWDPYIIGVSSKVYAWFNRESIFFYFLKSCVSWYTDSLIGIFRQFAPRIFMLHGFHTLLVE